MEVRKSEVEKQLGFKISEEMFCKSIKRARQKQESIISKYGDCGGKRLQAEYLIELIFEDIVSNIFSEATVMATKNVQNMEKSTRQIAEAPFVTDHIVAQLHK